MKDFAPLFKHVVLPETLDNRAQNGVNGYDSEKMAASLAILASGGEIQWSSRTEEGHKIDFLLSYEHPFYPQNRLIFQAQVKSGDSYGSMSGDGFRLLSRAKTEAQRDAKPVVLFWTNRRDKNYYWAYIHPKTKSGFQDYGAHHVVSPALRYDLARCEGNLYLTTKGGDGVFLKPSGKPFNDQRVAAKAIYKSLGGKCFSPNFGYIECTRIGWRHMFRNNRKKSYRESSCMVIRYLKDLLSQPPSTIYHSKVEIKNDVHPNYEVRLIEYILHYKACRQYNSESLLSDKHDKKTVAVRLIEEVRYPADWRTNGIVSQRVNRKVTLLSCYVKAKK